MDKHQAILLNRCKLKTEKSMPISWANFMIKNISTLKEFNQIKDDAFFTVLTSLSYEVLKKWANENNLHLFIRRNEDDENLFYICSFDYLFSVFENDEFDTSDWDYSFNVFLQRWDWEILGNWSEDDV